MSSVGSSLLSDTVQMKNNMVKARMRSPAVFLSRCDLFCLYSSPFLMAAMIKMVRLRVSAWFNPMPKIPLRKWETQVKVQQNFTRKVRHPKVIIAYIITMRREQVE